MSLIYNFVRGMADPCSPIGEIDENGYVYDCVHGVININSPIGKVDENGLVYDYAPGIMSTTPPIGKVDEKGLVYRGVPGMFEIPSYAGKVEGQLVYNCVHGTFDIKSPVGEIEGSDANKGGAALLLILLPRLGKVKTIPANDTPKPHRANGEGTGGVPVGCGCSYQILWIAFIAVVAIGVIVEEIYNILKTSWPYFAAAIVATPFVYMITRAYNKSKRAKTMVYAGIAVAMLIVIVFFSVGIYFVNMNKIDIQSQLQREGNSPDVYFVFLGITVAIPVICAGITAWMMALIRKNSK